MFGCNIMPCYINNNKFLWLIGIGVNETIKRKMNDGISISFCLRDFPEKVLIRMELTEDSLLNVWLASQSDPASTILRLSEIEAFYHGLLLHIKNTYGFSLEECTIKKVALNGVHLFSGAKFQMNISSAEIVYLILSFLHSDCINSLN